MITTTEASHIRVNLAVIKRLERGKLEDTRYNRYETLKIMRDNFLDAGIFTEEIKLLILTAQEQIKSLRAKLPTSWNELA